VDLSGKVAVITGSGRGLGLAYAMELARWGAAVVVNDVDEAAAGAAVKAIADAGGDAVAQVAPVGTSAAAQALVDRAVSEFGRLDVLVNNAGYANVNSIEDFAEDDFRAQIETDLWGVINLTRAAVPVLREQASGHILQISSVGGRDTIPGIGPYQTAKWAVRASPGCSTRSSLRSGST
jgi:NAD(P)-dependent dehydrogenase (short-subunit alcohol dehydrogenase family)